MQLMRFRFSGFSAVLNAFDRLGKCPAIMVDFDIGLLEFLAIDLHGFTPVSQAFTLNGIRANLIVFRDNILKIPNFMGRGVEKTSNSSKI